MKIFELSRPETIHDASNILYRAGYEEIGAGSFARTFAKPEDDSVIKLFKATDQAYIHFVYFCLKNRDNPNLPRFRGKLMKITDKYYAVRMEKLNPSSLRDAKVIHMIADAFHLCLWTLWTEDHEEFDNKFEKIREFDPNLAETIIELASWCKEHYPTQDIKTENVMKRGSTYVLTDPIAGGFFNKSTP